MLVEPSTCTECHMFTTEVPDVTHEPGETAPRRNARFVSQLISTPEPCIRTAYDILERAGREFCAAKAIGKRELLRSHKEENLTFYELSSYKHSSFLDFVHLALGVGRAFHAMGLRPKKDRVHLYGATHPNWLAAAHGAFSQGLTLVTAHDTLGEDGLTHALQQTDAKAIYLDPHLLKNLINPFKIAKNIQYVIYNDDKSLLTSDIDPEEIKADIRTLKDNHKQLQAVYSWSEFMQLGVADCHVEPTPPIPDDLACIMYTSGSTAKPKGVLISHRNLVAAITGLDSILGQHIIPGDSYLAYLPLSHMLEFAFETAYLYWGATMAYGTPKTILGHIMRDCRGDIAECRPTILLGIPAVWESVKKAIIANVGSLDPTLQNAFWRIIDGPSTAPFLANTSSHSAIDPALMKAAGFTGGRVRICITGGAPIAKGTQRFISKCIAPLISGYGLTETSAMGAIMDPNAWTDSALGEIPASVEVKLVDSGEYITTHDPPQGEIYIRGHSVSSGYLDLDEETEDAFSSDGWFKSGDIGTFDGRGLLKLIDRKKNLIKLPIGEYIALERLESIYRSCGIVTNICVTVRPERNRPMAVAMLNEATLRSVAASNDLQVKDLDKQHLYRSPKIIDLVLSEIQAAGKKENLAKFEIVEVVVLAEEEWTPMNGLLTSVGKLNRKGLQETYKKDIDNVYSDI